MAATAQVAVRPATENPGGSVPTESRWLIQICWRPAMPCEQRIAAFVQLQRGQPVFALLARQHPAAQQVGHQLLPVADAEHRHVRLRR